MKKRGSMHYDYYAWDGTGPRRQTSSKDASAVRIRCVHHSGLISKFVFHIYGEQLAVCVLKIEDGWRSALLSAPKGHLPKSITAVVRQHVGSGILDCDKVRDDVYKATGTSVTRSKVYNSARAVQRIKDKRGKRSLADWPRLFLQLRRGYFVKHADCSMAPSCLLFTDSMLNRYVREGLLKESVLDRKRLCVQGLYDEHIRNPSLKSLNDLLLQFDRRSRAFIYPPLVVDTTFFVGGHYLTVLTYKSQIFRRNSRYIYLPAVLFVHSDKTSATYKSMFDMVHSFILRQLGNGAHKFIVPGVVTDGCPALKLAIETSTLFRKTQHLLCSIHLARTLECFLRASGIPDSEIADAKAAIFGTRRNLSPEVPRVVTMSALDVAASERPAYVDALRIHPRAKDWFHNHSREVESVALESRLVALHGMESSTTNGVEGLNKEIPQWTGNGRNLPEVVENLQDRMEMMDRDLALSVLQRSDEITCERAGADRERVLKSLGMESTLVDVFSTLPFYDRIEATFSAKLLTGYRRQACELVVHSFSTVQHATFQKESGEVECVNFSEGTRVCSCRPASGMCAHILAVWNFLDPPDAAASIVKYLEVTEARAERYHKERSAGGSKCGKARRRTGTESTRRQNNLDVGEFVPNPYHIDAGVDKRSGYCGVDSAVETESLSHAVFAALSVDGIGDDLPADY